MNPENAGLVLVLLLVSIAAMFVSRTERNAMFYIAMLTTLLSLTALGIHIATLGASL